MLKAWKKCIVQDIAQHRNDEDDWLAQGVVARSKEADIDELWKSLQTVCHSLFEGLLLLQQP